MKTIQSSKARQNFFAIIKSAIKENDQYRVVHKDGTAVIMSEDDYENLLETLELLSTPGVAKSIRQAKKEIKSGAVYSLKEVFGK